VFEIGRSAGKMAGGHGILSRVGDSDGRVGVRAWRAAVDVGRHG
jgi:hypothetical protein